MAAGGLDALPRRSRGRPGSVVAVRLPEGPGAARIAVRGLDVAETPPDLGGRVGLPVRTGTGHLGSGQRLRDAVGPARVHGVVDPAALPGPDVVQAAKVDMRVEAERGHHVVGDRLRATGAGRRAGGHTSRTAASG